MSKRLFVLLLILPASLAANNQIPPANDAKGLAIAQEADRRDLGWQDSSADMLMILNNKQGEKSTREIRIR